MSSLINRAKYYLTQNAILDKNGTYTYEQLLSDSEKLASVLLNGKVDLKEQPIAFLAPSSYEYVVMQWGIWRAGGIAVPLCSTYPNNELSYIIEDIEPEVLLYHPDLEDKAQELLKDTSEDISLLTVNSALEKSIIKTLPTIWDYRKAMIVYTSGTTGEPKGVVSTHGNIEKQVRTLTRAWDWGADDYILNPLPLHHVHGITNVLCCTLWSGATCRFMETFDAEAVWEAWNSESFSLFMGVPTMYSKLIEAYESYDEDKQAKCRYSSERFRLMVSGSAALPVQILQKWKEITTHTLLERYGMTEIGMALSNTLSERHAGTVGIPLPDVKIRVLNEIGRMVKAGEHGELQVRGESVFQEYWNKPAATFAAFTVDGWFKTGDIVEFNEKGIYKIIGRQSVDIINTGGFKVSALEIEEALREHENVAECAVVGMEDEKWGEIVAAAIIPKGDFVAEDVREWMKDQVASEKVPRIILSIDKLPRNAMGKVVKPEVKELFING